MSPAFTWLKLTTILYLTNQALSSQQCLVVYVTIDQIEQGLDAANWEGMYSTDGTITEAGCLRYTTTQGGTLRYNAGSWALYSPTNEAITYTTTPLSPCNPPLINASLWTHGTDVNQSTITITCSYSSSPTYEPTVQPTYEPTSQPTTSEPTHDPTIEPTYVPTEIPSQIPTFNPTYLPTIIPTDVPTPAPTTNPTPAPTIDPTSAPSFAPVLAPSIAPTSDCSRIILEVRNPSDKMPSHIDGIYYQTPGYCRSDATYPCYTQYRSGLENNQQATNNVVIYYEDYWTIFDVRHGVILQYTEDRPQGDPLPTLHVPPESRPNIPLGWTDRSDNSFWEIATTCTSLTYSPTSDPTIEPTYNPTQDPTFEPTTQPTKAEPTFFPTVEPVVASTATIRGAGSASESFLDAFTVGEWLIVASIPLICCLIIGSLYVWRNRKIQEAIDKEAAHNLSANLPSDDEVEMAPQKKHEAKLNFAGHKRDSTADMDANFASALAVVSARKSQKSLNSENKNDGYQGINAQSPADKNAVTTTTTTAVTLVPPSPASQEPLINKQDSEFYGNHPIDEIYSYTFITKPFGMEWKTTKSDKKNLYVSRIQNGSQAALGNVKVGSKLISFNGEMIEGLGAKQIYGKLALSDMPLTITFLKPFKQEQEKEGDNYASPRKPTPVVPVITESNEPQNTNLNDENTNNYENDIENENENENEPQYEPEPEISNRDVTPPSNHHVTPDYAAADGDNSGDKPLIPPKAPSIPAYDNEENEENEENEQNEIYEQNEMYEENDPFSEIGPPPIPIISEQDEYNNNEPKSSIMTKAQALIPEVFNDDEIDEQESFHAD